MTSSPRLGHGDLAARLEVLLEPARRVVALELRRYWASADIRRAYVDFLVLMHGVVRSTVPLLELALERVRALRQAGPASPALDLLEAYFERHIREEQGHDVWVLEDLAATGTDPAGALQPVPSPAVAAFAGTQYYWVRHEHPAALLGHIAVMEGTPPTEALCTSLRRRTGFAEDAFRSLSRHAVLDRNHSREITRLLSALDLPPREQSLVGLSALQTAHSFAGIVADQRHRGAFRAVGGTEAGR